MQPNAWDASSVVRVGFQSVGYSRLATGGIDGTTSGMAALSVLASAVAQYQAGALKTQVIDRAHMSDTSGAVVLRAFDATPIRLRFGALQDVLMEHARYLIVEGGKYKAVPLNAYMEKNPKKKSALRWGGC